MGSLDRLNPLLRTTFATACAARLVSLLDGSDDVPIPPKEILSSTIGLLEADNREMGSTSVEWEAVLNRVAAILPTEDQASEQGWDLLDDAAAAVAYAIRTRLTGSSQEAAWSARRCYEYFDGVANRALAAVGVAEPAESRLLAHDEVQNELARQHELLKALQRPTATVTAIEDEV